MEIHGGPYLLGFTDYVIGISSDSVNPPSATFPAFIRGSGNTVIGMTQEAIDAGVQARIDVGTDNLAYTIIENIHFEGIPMGITGHDTNHVVVRDSEFSGQISNAVGVSSSEPWTYDTSFTTDPASDVLTTYDVHGLHTGDAVRFGQWDGLPTGLAINTTYYAIVLGDHSLKLATHSSRVHCASIW